MCANIRAARHFLLIQVARLRLDGNVWWVFNVADSSVSDISFDLGLHRLPSSFIKVKIGLTKGESGPDRGLGALRLGGCVHLLVQGISNVAKCFSIKLANFPIFLEHGYAYMRVGHL